MDNGTIYRLVWIVYLLFFHNWPILEYFSQNMSWLPLRGFNSQK